MNKVRRNAIYAIINALNELRDSIDVLEGEEEDCYYNLPEGLQSSDRGMKMEEAYGLLSEASDGIGTAIEALESAAE